MRKRIHEYYRELIMEKQKGRCPICFRVPEKYEVDHDHKTGEIRGLLCHSCNLGMGLLGDSRMKLRRAVRYLNDPPARGMNAKSTIDKELKRRLYNQRYYREVTKKRRKN